MSAIDTTRADGGALAGRFAVGAPGAPMPGGPFPTLPFQAARLSPDRQVLEGAASLAAPEREAAGEPSSWWRTHKTTITAILWTAGGVMSVIPTGVTQALGGGLMVTASALGLSDDIPALIEEPTLGHALWVALDVLGGIAGVGALASTFARGTVTATRNLRLLGGEARGGAVLGTGVTRLNTAAKITRGVSAIFDTAPARAISYLGLGQQATAFTKHAVDGELTAYDWIALASVGITAGLVYRGGEYPGRVVTRSGKVVRTTIEPHHRLVVNDGRSRLAVRRTLLDHADILSWGTLGGIME